MRVVLLLLALGASLIGQPTQNVISLPDCVIPFQFTTAGQVAPAGNPAAYNNKQVGCNVWQVQYANTGFSGVSLVLQSAGDSAGVPGAFGTIAGVVTQGTNPQTNTTGASNQITTYGTAFAPWVRVTDTTATGSGQITGVALGWRQLAAAGTGPAGSVNATIVSPLGQNPMASSVSVVAPNNQISGATRASPVNLASSGNTQILAGTMGQNIYIVDLQIATNPAEDIKLTEGTGSNCAMGTADVTGLYKNVTTWLMEPNLMALKGTAVAGDSLCVNQSASQAAGVTLWYILGP